MGDHVAAVIGGKHFESMEIDPARITHPPMLSIRFETPEVSPEIKRAQLRVYAMISRQIRRLRRESYLRLAPGWIDEDPPGFAFFGFAPRARPFDWATDDADLPPQPADPPYWQRPRRRMTLFLRPPAPVVQP
jgi:hypothetical protein